MVVNLDSYRRNVKVSSRDTRKVERAPAFQNSHSGCAASKKVVFAPKKESKSLSRAIQLATESSW